MVKQIDFVPEKIKPCNSCQDECFADKALLPTQEDDPATHIVISGKEAMPFMKAWEPSH